MNVNESKYVCLNCLIKLNPDNASLKDLNDNCMHVFCDKCGNEGIDVNIPSFDTDKYPDVNGNKETWGMK